MTGQQVDYEFGGEGVNDPEPFLMVGGRYCNTSVMLLTIEFALPFGDEANEYPGQALAS